LNGNEIHEYTINERRGETLPSIEAFNQEVNGRSADLQFNDSYTLRAGMFIR